MTFTNNDTELNLNMLKCKTLILLCNNVSGDGSSPSEFKKIRGTHERIMCPFKPYRVSWQRKINYLAQQTVPSGLTPGLHHWLS